MAKPVFEESQRFNQPWLWILMGCVILFSLGIIVYAYTQTDRPDEKEELIFSFLFVTITLGLVVAFLLRIRLETRLDKQGIHYRFRPFVWNWQLIPVSEIRSAEVVKYNPLHYGGWGYRLGLLGRGRAMNIRGTQGIRIEKANGKKLMIGTQIPNEASIALVNMLGVDK
jgi:hypothetical protein